ncbi:MAG: amidohydrolase family protein [Steroidobacteraceae bacterium]
MNRREFLTKYSLVSAQAGLTWSALGAGAVPVHAQVRAASSARTTTTIVDAHIHLYDTTRPQGVPFPPPSDKLIYRPMLPKDLREAAEPAGVRGAVFVECSPWVEDNQWVLDAVADEPFICAVVGNLDPEATEFPALLKRFTANPLYRGIRIRTARPMNFAHPRLRPHLESLAEAGCTLDVLLRGNEILRMAELAAALPGLRVMVDHLAHVQPSGKAPDPDWVARMEHFAPLPNVFCKVSRYTEQAVTQPGPVELAYYAPTFEVLWRIFGADRLAYGSNWPPCLQSGDYATTVTLAWDFFATKGPAALAKIMGRNAASFYGGPRFQSLFSVP